eukprot:TRINITY_DN73385_c0_g1_i1.p2 TRINITY_DN73385_c0_g1~~TRINITY_DN73385_c0_g1_i1.p2  ORF type:complete len:323 (+),score=99.89 TRINITY_DN73385_c0_g1_i1:187-1155(+)
MPIFMTSDGDMHEIEPHPQWTCGDIVQELRRLGVADARYLVSDGQQLEGSAVASCLGEGIVMVVEEIPSIKGELERGSGLLHREPQEAVQQVLRSDEQSRDISIFTRWFLSLGDSKSVTEAFDEVVQDRAIQVPDTSGPYEELLEEQRPIPEAKLSQLTSMGFPQDVAKRALWLKDLDVPRALNTLLEGQASRPITRDQFTMIQQQNISLLRASDAAAELVADEGIAARLPDARDPESARALSMLLDRNFRPMDTWRGNTVYSCLEAALKACNPAPQPELLREALAELSQHPQAIVDFLDDPTLRPFFHALVMHERSRGHRE